MIELTLSQFRYLQESGSVNGGALAWLVALDNGDIRDRTSGRIYRPHIDGDKVKLVPIIGRRVKQKRGQADAFTGFAPDSDDQKTLF